MIGLKVVFIRAFLAVIDRVGGHFGEYFIFGYCVALFFEGGWPIIVSRRRFVEFVL